MPRSAVKKDPDFRGRTRANVAPVILTKTYETGEKVVGQDVPRRMKSTGPAKESLEPATIVPVGRPVNKEKADMLVFMEDVLTIRVSETTNPLDDPMPEVWNDGIPQRFQRGATMKVKRKYVEVLARSKKTVYGQRKSLDDDGIESIEQVPHTAPKYPFSVLHDPNPRGADWLDAILAEA